MRKLEFVLDYIKNPEGSVLISLGETKVICNATIEEKVPPFLKNKGTGWINAEYSLLPRSTKERVAREAVKGKQSPRTVEISRLIARSLRAVVDLEKLGERSIIVDCDVISADGGTRTASITGGFLALYIAIDKLVKAGLLKEMPIKEFAAAVSVGIVDGEVVLDLDFEKDSIAEVDMNIVMTESGRFIEIQGTGEEATFTRTQLNEMLDVAKDAIEKIIEAQKKAVL